MVQTLNVIDTRKMAGRRARWILVFVLLAGFRFPDVKSRPLYAQFIDNTVNNVPATNVHQLHDSNYDAVKVRALLGDYSFVKEFWQ